MKILLSFITIFILLVGCATHPDNIEKVSTEYSVVGRSCSELSEEYNELLKTERYLYKELEDNYNTDIALVLTSVITLPLFFPKGTDYELLEVYTETVAKVDIIENTLKSHCILVQ